jgi:hypothetical protein
MKIKFLSLIVTGFLIVSVFGAFAYAAPKEKSYFIKQNLTFSKPTIEEHKDFIYLNLKEANSFSMTPNMPMIPCYESTFTFPIGTTIKGLTIAKNNVNKIIISKNLRNVPEPVCTNSLTSQNQKTTKIPELGDVYPENSCNFVVGRGFYHGERCIVLKADVYPAVYNAREGFIEYANDVEINIEYENPSVSYTFNEEYKYVIITADEFSGTLNDFVNYKNNRDISTKLVTLTEVYSGTYFPADGRDNAEKIKYFIKNAYDNWGTQYVLFVGGDDEFPTRDVHIYVDYEEGDDEVFISDLYFVDLYNSDNEFVSWDSNGNGVFGEYDWGSPPKYDEFDLFPDVCLGRLAVKETQELQSILDKIVEYETQESWTKDWFSKIVVIGGDTVPEMLGDDTDIDEGEYVNQAILNIMDGFQPDKIWDSNKRLSGISPSGVDNINNGINSGAGFVDWAGHGAPKVWTTFPHNGNRQSLPTPWGSYYNNDIMDLTNGYKLPIVVTGACSVACFNRNSDCFTWAFVKNPNGGGIASVGPSGLSWGESGPTTTDVLEGRMQVSLFGAYDDGVENFGQMWANGITKYIRPTMNGMHHKTCVQWQPFGDPTLQIAAESQPPLKPEAPSGPSSGKVGEEYIFNGSTTDPENNDIYYRWDWGDDTYSQWLGPYNSGEECQESHIWNDEGNFEVRIQARDTNGKLSDWSDPLPISMPKTRLFRFDILQKYSFIIIEFITQILKLKNPL